jgi:hypothetical protein
VDQPEERLGRHARGRMKPERALSLLRLLFAWRSTSSRSSQ